MSSSMYVVAFLSGVLYGCVELLIAHRRMKRAAMLNPWSALYLLGHGLLATGVFALLTEGTTASIHIASDDNNVNSWAIAFLSGPLIGVVLRRLGGYSKGSSVFTSYRDKVFKFLTEEVQHAVDVKRVELSRQVSDSCGLEEIYQAALDFAKVTTAVGKARDREMEYLNELLAQETGILLARYLIEAYGDGWVRRNLLRKSETPSGVAN